MSLAKRQRNVTQKSIAEALNISQATVAMALNECYHHRLLPETVALVKAKAAELKYRPQHMARVLRGGRSHTLGAVFLSGPYHGPQERLKYLARHALEAGFKLIATDMDWFGRNEEAAQDYLLDAAVEGLILCNLKPGIYERFLEFSRERGLPMLTLGGTHEQSSIDGIRADMEGAFFELTRHHIECGSRHLCLMINLPKSQVMQAMYPFSSAYDRIMGFIKALRAAGGKLLNMSEADAAQWGLDSADLSMGDEELVGEVVYVEEDLEVRDTFEIGRAQMISLIKRGPLPDSLVCSNDNLAVGVMSICRDVGIEIPTDVRISGVDDSSLARYGSVPLTSIRQPSEEMARWSVNRLLELIERPESRKQIRSVVSPCQIIPRYSTTGRDDSVSPEVKALKRQWKRNDKRATK